MPSVWIERKRYAHGLTYLVRAHNAGRRVAAKGFRSKPIAQRYAAQLREELEAGRVGLRPGLKSINTDEFAARYRDHAAGTKSAGTAQRFDHYTMRDFLAFTGVRPLISIDRDQIDALRNHLAARYRPATVSMRLRGIRTALNYAVAMNWLPANPAAKIKLPRVDPAGRELLDAEITRLYAASEAQVLPAIGLALQHGFRLSELLGLTWAGVRAGRAEILRTKTGAPRVVPLSQEALRIVDALPRPGPRVIDWLNADGLQWFFRKAVRQAGLGRVRFHDLRHTWATRYMRETGNVFALMQEGGWRSLDSVKVYQHHIGRGQHQPLPPFPHQRMGEITKYIRGSTASAAVG